MNIHKSPSLNSLLDDVFSKYCQRIRHFKLATLAFEIHFYGDFDEAFFCDAIAHLEIPARAEGALKIAIIDQRTTGQNVPELLREWPEIDAYSGDMLDMPAPFFGNCNPNSFSISFINYTTQQAAVWLTDAANLPTYERSFPLRQFFYFWFRNSSHVMVHAGAPGLESGGVLLAGKGGSGKSTSTMACLDSTLQYAGDDFILIETQKPFVHSLYNVAKLEEHNLVNFPHLRPHVHNWESVPVDKAQLFLSQFMPSKVIHGFPLKAILLPKFTGQSNTTYRPASKAEAMKALVPSSVWLLRSDTYQVEKISRLVRQLPCFWLETGTDLAQIPTKIIEILAAAVLDNKSNPFQT